MFNPMDFTSRELMVRNDVIEALGGKPHLPKILEATRASLLEFVQADSVALCLMRPARPFDFRWHVPGPPLPILDEYAGLEDHDFLRAPIIARPGVPICDAQLLSRGEYERTIIYQRSQELDLPLEHIMAVLVPIHSGLVGALAFYRHERPPFTSQSITALSSITRHVANTLRNCEDIQDLDARAQLLEALYPPKDSAFLILDASSREVSRSPQATTLLERWFTPSEFHASGLPILLKERLDALVRMDPDSRLGKTRWSINHDDVYRTCRFIELPANDAPRRWALLLTESPCSIPLPLNMQRGLTRRELEIARGVLQNLSNEEIADELKISGETVRTHVRNLFDKLRVHSRADFLYQVTYLNRPM